MTTKIRTRTPALRVPGHTLRGEGAAYGADTIGTYRIGSGSYTGSALCSCGELSPKYMSNYLRKRWHRDVHKPSIVASLEASR